MKKILLLILMIFISSYAFANVPNATPLKNVYTCNGSTTQFPYSFPISATTDMTVSTVDTSGNITPQTSFSVDTTNVWVNYPLTGPNCPTGTSLVLLPKTPQTQITTYSARTPFTASAVGASFDKITMISQQLQEQLNRAILAPINSNAGSGYALPNPLANAYLGWDPTGTFLTNINASQNLAPGASPTFVGLTLTGLSGILKSSGASGVGIATADTDYSVPNGVETLTNKTFDTAGTGNVFKLNGTQLAQTGVTGNGANLMTATGSYTTNHCLKIDANGNAVDNGSTCSGGTGMVYPGTSGIPITNTSGWLTSLGEVDGDIILGAGGNWTVASPPTWNQNTTGSAAKWTTARTLAGNSVDGSANKAFSNAFIVQGTTDAGLTGAQFLGALGTGLVKNTTTTGVLSIATAGTDYAPATSGSSMLYGNGSGGFSNVTVGTGLSFSGGSLTNTITANVHGVQLFTSSGTFTAPTGVTQVFVSMIAGGGGAPNFENDSGASGMYILQYPYTVIAGNSYGVTIGAGGAAGNNSGGNTVFDASGGALTVLGGVYGSGGAGGVNPAGQFGLSQSGTTTAGGSSPWGTGATSGNASGYGAGAGRNGAGSGGILVVQY